MSEVESIWSRAKQRGGHPWDRRRPSNGIAAVLLVLLDGAAHGSEVARRAGQSQPNVTANWLPKLLTYGFVDAMETPGIGRNGGGRPGTEWSLTTAGKQLARLIREEEMAHA